MKRTDLTIEILKGIREDTHELRKGLQQTNERLATLENRQTQGETRLATEIVGVAGAVREVRDLLREDRALRERVDDHERRLSAVERRPV